jgi:hypothetical protein
MRRACLALARFCSAFWVGAAFLFVTTSVTEQMQPSFDAATKDTLALIRFPWYYGAGTVLLVVGASAAALAGRGTRTNVNPVTIAALLLLFADVLLWTDYAWVYRPLRELLMRPGDGHGVAFGRLHHWSEGLNAAGFLLSAAAAVTLCAAREDGTPQSNRGEAAP